MDLTLRTAMLETMKDFLKARDMCVLATCAEEKPHCSLKYSPLANVVSGFKAFAAIFFANL
jgi:hypothetical protein